MRTCRLMLLIGLLVTALPAPARAESFMLACESRSEKPIGPNGSPTYDRPITLSVDTDRQVIELLTEAGTVWRSTMSGLYVSPLGSVRGPLRVEISERSYQWGAPFWPDNIRYYADFSGVVNRLTGSAQVGFQQDSRSTSSVDFVGACRRIAGPKL